MKEVLKKNNLNVVLVIFGVVILVLIFVLVALLSGGGNVDEQSGPEVDVASGEIVWDIDEEPEASGELTMLGFHTLSEFGFMSGQYNKIVGTVKAYVESEHPEYKQVNYLKDSFKYEDAEREKSSFVFVANVWDKYIVELDTHGNLWDIDVEIVGEQ